MVYGAVAILSAYLLGSINFAVIFTRLFTKKDVRNYGSGNAGTTNVMRVGGVVPGILTFVCDMLKGFFACYIGKILFECLKDKTDYDGKIVIYGTLLCGVFCTIGHVFPVFFEFKGGKGVAVGAGVFLCVCPKALVIGLLIFAVLMLITRIVSLSSLAATTAVVVCNMIFYNKNASFIIQAVMALAVWLIIILKHSDNIKRLVKGEEKKLTISKADKSKPA